MDREKQVLAALATTLAAIAPAVAAQTNEGSNPQSFRHVGAWTVFFADDGEHGQELWRTDGTEEGTEMVLDVNPGVSGSEPQGWGELDDALFFQACRDANAVVRDRRDSATRLAERCVDEGIWRTDGTTEGTRRVATVDGVGGEAPFAPVGRWLLFAAQQPGTGVELWRTDGTEEGTELLVDLQTGAQSSRPTQLFSGLGSVWFSADDGSGSQLWKTDGTARGTVAVARLKGGYDGWHWAFAEFDGTLYFTADDGRRGGELWRSDGTPKGTRLVREIRPGAKGAQLFEITELQGALYFSAHDGKEREVVRTDGSKRGTRTFDLNPSGPAYPDHMARLGERILLYAWDEDGGGELWSIGGSRTFTGRVLDIKPGKGGSGVNLITPLDDQQAVFVAERPAEGMELWTTDGTPAGTRLLADTEPGPASGRPRYLERSGDLVWFAAGRTRGQELWVTDGTVEGTRLVKDINQQPSSRRGRSRPD